MTHTTLKNTAFRTEHVTKTKSNECKCIQYMYKKRHAKKKNTEICWACFTDSTYIICLPLSGLEAMTQ